MKGFLKWFKSGTKMKRWMFLILVGIALSCYGVSEIIAMKSLSILDLVKVVVLFIIGFILIVVGLVYSQKRVLELLIEETDDRIGKNDKDVNVKSLIFNKKIYNQGPKIVAIGGGSGLNTVLKGLKHYTDNITAIVETSGYSKQYILDGIAALAKNEEEMETILKSKIAKNRLPFGESFLQSMQSAFVDLSTSMENLSKVLNITGRIIPVTMDEMTVCAELEDGTIIDDKEKLPNIVMDKITKINRVFVSPTNCKTAPGVIEAIMEADAIIIGPGSLYTNVIPNLLIKNVSKAIEESKAKKIYISNIMTEPGQTDDFSLYDHIKAILDHARNSIIDYCIYDTGEIIPEYVRRYNEQGADIVEQDIKKIKDLGIRVIQRNFSVVEDHSIRHDPVLVADSIIELICDDMVFKDMQNAPQYISMSTKLKKSNKKRKITQNKKKPKEKNRKTKPSRMKTYKKKSKFANKYNERIKSIQESEEMRQKRLESLKK
ncbi:MAG: YvcK family protein [Clostridia bacterium]|nr:YvcK family protein [Clostridia bacterium]